jgi:hypothetical protein
MYTIPWPQQCPHLRRAPSADALQVIFDDAARQAEAAGPGVTDFSDIMSRMYVRIQDEIQSFTLGGVAAYQSYYQLSIGYMQNGPPAPPIVDPGILIALGELMETATCKGGSIMGALVLDRACRECVQPTANTAIYVAQRSRPDVPRS